ncbi:MAG TPA: hypothetical protein VK147_02855 [Candidatus Didemnitutus sp.]|nr:hypothetical protein [Candidatus Didemnitutus sp.]
MRILSTIIATATALLCLVNFAHAQWQQLNGPFGGGVSGFAVVDSTVFTTNDEHLFRSADLGATWEEVGRGQLGAHLGVMAVLGNTVYVSCGDSLTVSADRGDSWRRLNKEFDRIRSLSVMGSTLIAACYYDILISTDLGESWTSIRAQAPFEYPYTITQGGDLLFLLKNQDHHMSTDTGRTWRRIADSTQRNYTTFLVEGDRILGGSNQGLHVSTDRGESWTRIGNELRLEEVLQLERIGGHVFAVTQNGVFRSTTNGVSWEHVFVPISKGKVQSIIGAGGRLLISHNTHGVYVSIDSGTSWTRSNNGLIALTVNGLLVYRNRLFAACGPRGFYVSDDLGTTWEEVGGFQGVDVTCLADAGKNIVAGTSNGWYRSADTGRTWQRHEDSYTSNKAVFAIAYENGLLAMISNYARCVVYTSSDDGASWQFRNDSKLPAVPLIHTTYNIENRVTINSGVVCAITDGGLSISENQGRTWRTVDAYMLGSEFAIAYTAVAAHGNNVVVAGWLNQYRSTDVGRTWTVIGRLEDHDIRFFLRYGNGFIAVSQTLRYIADESTNWIDISDGLKTAYTCQALQHDNYFYACGSGDGIWRRPIESIVHVDENDHRGSGNAVHPGSVALWPTPTSTQATLSFTTTTAGSAVISFIDPLGQTAYTSTTTLQSGGDHTVHVDTTPLPSGWYAVVITTHDQVLVGRCIVERTPR